ncbi:hypothetical protein M011DRAFT_397785 [Sporormia fimetaria CBS 119925]|uniref:F-box domain-containing protein n=1 Tax=Sporormia fimetaria CBS 119925 TaxID=1340428 RepID=A0A6A6VLE8_9PLEO|nr:hypothetical protein M011DRAFT_397785 [Sporormia fimetaria CBS 119925]
MRTLTEEEEQEPLEDKTAAIPLRSNRTKRIQKKKAAQEHKQQINPKPTLPDLPTELILDILELLRPSDIFTFSSVNRRFNALVNANADKIGDEVIRRRYAILSRCFPVPVLLSAVEPSVQPLLSNPRRGQQLGIHRSAYQHVQPPDAQVICTCLTCILAWNNLSLVLDFAHWQDNLDNGVPIPMLPRGRTEQWNEELVSRNARIARKALEQPLWHALILEAHLASTVRAIRRHHSNKGNQRKHVHMSEAEAASGSDHFLAKEGPLSLEFPYNRDEYYMLEAYLPNRWWRKFERYYFYTLEGQHERDVEMVVRTATQMQK